MKETPKNSPNSPKIYSFPQKYQEKIEAQLVSLGFSLKQPKKLADAILNLSTHYQNSQSKTPWENPNIQAAYLSYFFPLNYVRHLKILSSMSADDFKDQFILDFGFGLGSSRLALLDQNLITEFHNYWAIESEVQAQKISSQLDPRLSISPADSSANSLIDESFQYKKSVVKIRPNTLAIFSYSLNELPQLPRWIFDCEKLLILEPSTQIAGRQLMTTRQELIDHGFQIKAPCTHQGVCPLLSQSQKDWCHDRIHWQPPEWFLDIEKYLPIKNKTLTTSYLWAIKTPSSSSMERTTNRSRVVGDQLTEKGKTKWLICRNQNREFFSWLKRQGPPPEFFRGDLIQIESAEPHGNELRTLNVPKILD